MDRKECFSWVLVLGCLVALPAPAAAEGLPPDLPGSYGRPDGADRPDIARWWAGLGSPALSDLVAAALEGSPSIDLAEARVREARASLTASRANLLPALSVSGRASDSRAVAEQGIVQDQISLGIDASYELDVFGGLSHSAKGAAANVRSSIAALHDAQRTLVAEVAINFVQYQLTAKRLQIARSNLALQQDTRDIAHWREAAGLGNLIDSSLAEAQMQQTAASIPLLDTQLRQTANRLATLVGKPAGVLDSVLTEAQAPITIRPPASTGVPAELLERRPDIAAAQANLVAASEAVGTARAALFPRFTLAGSITRTSTSPAGLADSVLGSLVANVAAPFFNGGQRKAGLRGAEARRDAALSTYRETVLGAFEEVRNALVSNDNTSAREANLQQAAASAEIAATLAATQYRAGLIDFRSLLNAQRTLLNAQDSLASARADRALAAVQLYKALGGGWEPAPIAQQQDKP